MLPLFPEKLFAVHLMIRYKLIRLGLRSMVLVQVPWHLYHFIVHLMTTEFIFIVDFVDGINDLGKLYHFFMLGFIVRMLSKDSDYVLCN